MHPAFVSAAYTAQVLLRSTPAVLDEDSDDGNQAENEMVDDLIGDKVRLAMGHQADLEVAWRKLRRELDALPTRGWTYETVVPLMREWEYIHTVAQALQHTLDSTVELVKNGLVAWWPHVRAWVDGPTESSEGGDDNDNAESEAMSDEDKWLSSTLPPSST
jgi:hypothetical protein